MEWETMTLTETVRRTLKGLLELRDLDRELERLRRRCRECPALIEKHKREFEDEGQVVADRTKEIENTKLEIRRLEGELKSCEEEITKLSTQLLSSKTNQEYSAFQSQIDRKKSDKSDYETGILEILDRIDGMEKELKEAVMEQQIREKEFEDLKASLEGDLEAYTREAEELTTKRNGMLYNLDPEALKTYERVRTALDGDAIVHVENRICSGCYMSITSNDYVRICGMREIVTCKSCQRILYIPEYLEKQE